MQPRICTYQDSATLFESRHTDVPRHVSDVGINCNKWRRPVKEFGPWDTGLLEQILRHDLIRDFDVDPDDWKKSIRAINILMENIRLKEFQTQASYYKGLLRKKRHRSRTTYKECCHKH